MKKILTFIRENWPIILITLAAAFFRFWRLKFPQEVVFDETYYAKFAQNYLTATPFFDVHPPLGKVLIGAGEKIFGNNSFGWRVVVAAFGTLIIPLSYLVAFKTFKNKATAIITSLLILFDGLFLVESRTGLLINTLLFFVLASYYFILRFDENRRWLDLVLGSVFTGCAISVQWLAAPLWLTLGVYLLLRRKLNFWQALVLILMPAGIYVLQMFFDLHQAEYHTFWQYFMWWNEQALGYHEHLKEGHPYASRWWTWLVLYRPVWFFAKTIDGKFNGVDAIGNPLIWWPALPVFIYSIFNAIKNRKNELYLLAASFILYYLMWILISRTQFQYYILPVLPFYFMVLAYYLQKIYAANKYFVYVYLILVAIVFFAFYPILTSNPVTDHYWRSLMIFRSWI